MNFREMIAAIRNQGRKPVLGKIAPAVVMKHNPHSVKPAKGRVNCPVCRRKVRAIGLKRHMAAKHGRQDKPTAAREVGT